MSTAVPVHRSQRQEGTAGADPSPGYFGRVKTRFQLYLAATVANLTLVAGKIGLSDSVGGGAEAHRAVLSDVQAVSHDVVAHATAIFGAVRLGQLWSQILFASALLPKSLSPTRPFRPGF